MSFVYGALTLVRLITKSKIKLKKKVSEKKGKQLIHRIK